jgi:YgiT-type zinc finger domain-containing protein
MGRGWAHQEGSKVKCRICGGAMEERVTDLPFKIGDTSIVIVRSLPVLQCRQCGEAELENVAMSRVDRLLAAVDRSAELEVVRYAA